MKYEIMLNILFELLAKKTVSASYLSKKYQVSTRSIYRYLESMELAGVPIYTTRGNNGGISIIDTYRFTSTFMTIKEYEQIISILSGVNQEVPNKTLENAILKLKANIKNEYSGFDIKSGNLIIDGGPWGDTDGYKSKLKILQTAIDENKKLEIIYHDRTGKITTRVIEPHVIVFKQGLWYTYAYCNLRKTFRFFKTGRIESAKILNETFTRHDLSKMELPLDFWHNAEKTEYVSLEIKSTCLSDVMEWLGIENIEKDKNGKYIANVNLPYDDGLIYKIMSYGDGIKVLSPNNLKEKIGIKKTIKELDTFIKDYSYMWHKENKAFGWEIICLRFGTLKERLKYCQETLNKYLKL